MEQTEQNSKIKYIFVVDRSGSMTGKPIDVTKEALLLFMNSLPAESEVEIVSFGSNFDYVANEGEKTFKYNNDTAKTLKREIMSFQANYGGTRMFQPLEDIFEDKEGHPSRRVFLLTDGNDSNK